MTDREKVVQRLTAYIHPAKVETQEQEFAFEDAVDMQAEYEASQSADGMPSNVRSFSIGGYSVSLDESNGSEYTRDSICPAAWARLFNAGLIRHSLPVARRL